MGAQSDIIASSSPKHFLFQTKHIGWLINTIFSPLPNILLFQVDHHGCVKGLTHHTIGYQGFRMVLWYIKRLISKD
jgi:hypothetical protein